MACTGSRRCLERSSATRQRSVRTRHRAQTRANALSEAGSPGRARARAQLVGLRGAAAVGLVLGAGIVGGIVEGAQTLGARGFARVVAAAPDRREERALPGLLHAQDEARDAPERVHAPRVGVGVGI